MRSSTASGSSLPDALSKAVAKPSASAAISSRLAKTMCRSFSDMSGWPGMRFGSEGTTVGRRSARRELDDAADGRRGESNMCDARRADSGMCEARRGPRDGEGGLAEPTLPSPRPVLMTWSAICAMSGKYRCQPVVRTTRNNKVRTSTTGAREIDVAHNGHVNRVGRLGFDKLANNAASLLERFRRTVERAGRLVCERRLRRVDEGGWRVWTDS